MRSGAALTSDKSLGLSSFFSPNFPLLPITGHLFACLHFSVFSSSNYSLFPYFLHLTRNSGILMSACVCVGGGVLGGAVLEILQTFLIK